MMDSARPDSFELSDYLGLLRRRWLTIAAFTCAGLVAAAAYLVVAPKTYTATSTVFVNANAANTSALLNQKTTSVINMDNEAQIVLSVSVAAPAARQLASPLTPRALLQQVSVTVPANTQVLQISCDAHSAAGAAACAQAFASSYLTIRQATARAKIDTQIQNAQQKESKLQKSAIKLQDKLNGDKTGTTAYATDHAALESVSSQLAPLRDQIANLGTSSNQSAGYIITPATVPSSPSSPKAALYGPSGLLVGMLIGLVIAFAKDRRDKRIHAAPDVERFMNLPVLFAPSERTLGPLTAIAPAGSPAKRAFGELARSIAATLGDGNHVLLVVGTSSGPGTSVVAANLAATLARTRTDVMLICAGRLDKVSAQLLGVAGSTGRGLTEIIAGTATPAGVALRHAEIPRLKLITPGQSVTTALDDLPHESIRRLIADLAPGHRLRDRRGHRRRRGRGRLRAGRVRGRCPHRHRDRPVYPGSGQRLRPPSAPGKDGGAGGSRAARARPGSTRGQPADQIAAERPGPGTARDGRANPAR